MSEPYDCGCPFDYEYTCLACGHTRNHEPLPPRRSAEPMPPWRLARSGEGDATAVPRHHRKPMGGDPWVTPEEEDPDPTGMAGAFILLGSIAAVITLGLLIALACMTMRQR